jgi:hypothetical protein
LNRSAAPVEATIDALVSGKRIDFDTEEKGSDNYWRTADAPVPLLAEIVKMFFGGKKETKGALLEVVPT